MAENAPSHEARDVAGRFPAYVMVGVAVFVVLSTFGLSLLFQTVWQPPTSEPSPFAGEAATVTRQPALQQDPASDIAALNQRLEQRLQSVGWIDREANRVHMPIDRAMTLLVERGLPDPPSKPMSAPPRNQDER